MFCPKCGSQNTDATRFCRGCGADLSNVLAVVEGKTPGPPSYSKEYHDLYSSGLRNIILGFGFLLIAFLLFTTAGNPFLWLGMMIPAIVLLATGIPRLVKAEGLKTTRSVDAIHPDPLPAEGSGPALPPVQTDYIEPTRTFDDAALHAEPPSSVTEPTTRQLQMDPAAEDDRKSKI